MAGFISKQPNNMTQEEFDNLVEIMNTKLEDSIKNILCKHYGEILSELEEVMNTDCIELDITIKSDEYKIDCKLQ